MRPDSEQPGNPIGRLKCQNCPYGGRGRDSTTTLTLHVPLDDHWWIAVNGIGVLEGEALRMHLGSGFPLSIEFSARGGATDKVIEQLGLTKSRSNDTWRADA